MPWPKMSIRRFSTDGAAQCEGCGGPWREWTRERARQHARLNPGHKVRFVIEDTTIYEVPRGSDDDGQRA